MWWFTFDGEVNSECGGLENFAKSDMKMGESFGFIAVECFVSIGEDIIIERIICSG